MESLGGVHGTELSSLELIQIASELNEVGFNVSIQVGERGASVLQITKRTSVIEISGSHPHNDKFGERSTTQR